MATTLNKVRSGDLRSSLAGTSGWSPNAGNPQGEQQRAGDTEPEPHDLEKSRPRQIKLAQVSGAAPVTPRSATFSVGDKGRWKRTEVDDQRKDCVSWNQEQDYQKADVCKDGARRSKHPCSLLQPFLLRGSDFRPHVAQCPQPGPSTRPAGVACPYNDADSRQYGECHLQRLPSDEQGAALPEARRRSSLHYGKGTP